MLRHTPLKCTHYRFIQQLLAFTSKRPACVRPWVRDSRPDLHALLHVYTIEPQQDWTIYSRSRSSGTAFLCPSCIPPTDLLLVPLSVLSSPPCCLFLSLNAFYLMPSHFSSVGKKFTLVLFSSFRAGSIKSSRRSSYLLAITTERSKSCDEGLHTLRDDSRVFSWVLQEYYSWFIYCSVSKFEQRSWPIDPAFILVNSKTVIGLK